MKYPDSHSAPSQPHIPQLLPHELSFVRTALRHAQAATVLARVEYGDAVDDSGGDWVFDDPGAQLAMLNTAMKELSERQLTRLSVGTVIDYPRPDVAYVAPGSRIGIEIAGDVDMWDVGTQRIPGLPIDPTILSLVSAQSPLGKAAIGMRAGTALQWELDNGRRMGGVLQSVDQIAQPHFYRGLGLIRGESQ